MNEVTHLISVSEMFEIKFYCTGKWFNARRKTIPELKDIATHNVKDVTCPACLKKFESEMDEYILKSILPSCTENTKPRDLYLSFNKTIKDFLDIDEDYPYDDYEAELNDAIRRGYIQIDKRFLLSITEKGKSVLENL